MISHLVEDFKKARRISTSIVAITSADQSATITSITSALSEKSALLTYNVAQGFVPINDTGLEAVAILLGDEPQMNDLFAEAPDRAMVAALNLPQDSILFFLNAQCQLSDKRIAQAIALMRDTFKVNRRMIVLLGPQFTLPEQIAGDVLTLDDPLPSPEEISELLDNTYECVRLGISSNEELPDPDEETRRKAIEAVRGLHAAAIDQAFSFSMEKSGINVNTCWLQKRDKIEQTRGLSFYRGSETFTDVGGLVSFKEFMNDLYCGPKPFRLVVWLDEIEKCIGSATYDGDGGVGRDQLACLLTSMEDNLWQGLIAVGPPGCSKSLAAKATGNTFGVPVIRLDLGAMLGSLVGESQGYIRQTMKVLYGIGGDGVFFIATSNGAAILPPELQRRFNNGLWFFDIPDEQERLSIWDIQLSKFDIPKQELPNSKDWVGSDIRNCCDSAYRRNKTLIETSKQIMPLIHRDPDRVRKLREAANNTMLSASYEGPYIYRGELPVQTAKLLPAERLGRKIELN